MNIKQAISKLSSALQWAKQSYTDKAGLEQVKYWLDGDIDSTAISLLDPHSGGSVCIQGKPYILSIRKAGSEYTDSRGYKQQRKSHSVELRPNTRVYSDVAGLID